MQLGERIDLRKTDSGEWFIVDRKFPFNDVSISTSDAYMGVRCGDWYVEEIDKDMFDTAPNPRFLMQLSSINDYSVLSNEIQTVITGWTRHALALTEVIRTRLGYDQTQLRERERQQSSKRQLQVEQKLLVIKRQLSEIRSRSWVNLSIAIKRRNINQLVHFTKFENLEGILLHGLLPNALRKGLELNTPWQRTDWLRLDGLPEANCLSVTRPNFPMFHRKRSEGGDWIVIGFNPNQVLKHPSIFVETNAARGGAFNFDERELSRLATPEAFERMFSKTDSNLTRDPQAEILVFDTINSDEILFIALSPNRIDEQLHSVGVSAPKHINFLSSNSEIYRKMF